MRSLQGTAAIVVAIGLAGCDAVFVEPAPAPTALAISIAPSLLMQPDTFKQSDNGTVRVLAGSDTIKKEDFQFAPGSAEVKIQVELPSDISANQVVVEIELRRGKDPLFAGSQSVALKKGVNQPVEIAVGVIDYCTRFEPIVIGQSINDNLARDRDCIEPNGLMQRRFLLRLAAPAVFKASLSSAAFAPRLEVRQPVAPNGIPIWGASSAAGSSFTQEIALPAGSYWVLAADQTSFSGSPGGTYTLSTTAVAEPQVGQAEDAPTAVTFGTVANGRITAQDPEDRFDNEPATLRRVDGYLIRLLAGETVTVTLRADFPANFTRWDLVRFQEGIFDIPAGTTRTITFTAPGPSITYQAFYVITAGHEGRGAYTMSFARGSPAAPSIAIKSLTQNGVPLNPNDVRGSFQAEFAINAPAEAGLGRLEVVLNSGVVCNQPLASTGAFDQRCTVNTQQLNATGGPAFPNGTYTMQARLFGATGPAVATTSTTIRVNN